MVKKTLRTSSVNQTNEPLTRYEDVQWGEKLVQASRLICGVGLPFKAV